MKKSLSMPCFMASSTSTHSLTSSISTSSLTSVTSVTSATSATSAIKRNISMNALFTIDNPIEYNVDLLKNELEYVSLHYPINNLLSCNSSHISPILTVLNINAPSHHIENIDDELKDIGACLAEPYEVEYEKEKKEIAREEINSRYYWLEKAMTCKKTRKRYKAIYSRIKKN